MAGVFAQNALRDAIADTDHLVLMFALEVVVPSIM
jgi:hypothetical protein